MIKLGIIGYSKLNGHPYSFSGIINGINEYYFRKNANWPFIYDYLIKNKKKIGFKRRSSMEPKSVFRYGRRNQGRKVDLTSINHSVFS